MKVGFIGIGKLGQDCAEVIAEKHFVEGYDIEKKNPQNFQQVDTIEQVVKDKDIVFIAVPTPHSKEYDGSYPSAHLDPKDFSYDLSLIHI